MLTIAYGICYIGIAVAVLSVCGLIFNTIFGPIDYKGKD